METILVATISPTIVNPTVPEVTTTGSIPDRPATVGYTRGHSHRWLRYRGGLGGKSALDQTLLYGATEVSEPNGHVRANYHLVLAGHAGGTMTGNQHLRFPGSRKVTELQLTMLQMIGVELERFGSWDNTSNTIPEIMG